MEEIKDYKNEIAATRVGSLGSSDGRMLAQIASLGIVPHSALKRLAVCKGLIPQTEIPKTAAIQAGDDLEMLVYEHLTAKDPRYTSNPLWISAKYSRKNVRLISHPDIVLKDDAQKTLFVYEVKTTKFSFEETKATYRPQLFIHFLLGKETAKSYGDDWKVKVFLVHYSTDGLDLTDGITFEPERLTVKSISFNAPVFDIKKAMDVVDAFLEDFTEYYDGDEIDADLLPAKVKDEFDAITNVLAEIKEREKKVDDFKKRLYAFMVEKNIKSLKNNVFSITRVDATESKSFDSKQYIEDLKKEHPRKAKKVLAQYAKTTKRNGYVSIKVKDNND